AQNRVHHGNLLVPRECAAIIGSLLASAAAGKSSADFRCAVSAGMGAQRTIEWERGGGPSPAAPLDPSRSGALLLHSGHELLAALVQFRVGQVFLARRDRPAMPERIVHDAVAVAPELIVERHHFLRA